MARRNRTLSIAVAFMAILVAIPIAAVLASDQDPPAAAARSAGPVAATDTCVPLIIDFETDGNGSALQVGDLLSGAGNQRWSNYGITVSTDAQDNSNPANSLPVMIFDSANPTGGDPDLGTPNNHYVKTGETLCPDPPDGATCGPGDGAAGKPDGAGPNRYPLDNIMIISEDGSSSNPDDSRWGGTISFVFDEPKRVDQVLTLDYDDPNQSYVKAFSDVNGNTQIKHIDMTYLGENSFEAMEIDAIGVRRLDIHLGGSGGIPAIIFCAELDWGDLPYDPDGTIDLMPDGTAYPTLRAQDGARHLLLPGRVGPTLGDIVDSEADGIPEGQALGDDYDPLSGPDDEDGVGGYSTPMIPGKTFTLTITGTLNSRLDAWIDFGGDGNLDPWDRIADNLVLTAVGQELVFTVPATMSTDLETYGRFRLSSEGGLEPTGLADDGEVEDYLFESRPPLDTVFGPISGRAYIDAVLIEWESYTEIDIIGYNLERALGLDGPWTQLNASLIPCKSMGQVTGALYEYVDPAVEAGAAYYYRLVSINKDSTPSYENPIRVIVPLMGQPYEPYVPPTPSSLYRIYLPFFVR